jgi:protein-tyrosine kinase
MLIPKASHLVERVAERLLRSGALDDSAAQLMRRPDGDGTVAGAGNDATVAGAPESAPPLQRSSLFAPPPAPPAAAGALPAIPVLGQGSQAADRPVPSPAGDAKQMGDTLQAGAPARISPALASPAILGHARTLGHSAGEAEPLVRPADFAPLLPQRGPIADPAAGLPRGADPAALLPQGPLSVDAVSLERAGMVDWSRTRTRISEEFRLVQRQIIRSAFGPGAEPGFSNLLLVTSSRPGEGKSFMSTNLAGSIARQGDHHVLLVDADSKRDSICYSLGLAQARGLLDLAANPKLDPAPLIVKTPIERLSILPVGRERERSAELFSTKEMTRLIQSLGRRYADRLLILDAPPCLSTSDPAVLAQVVGQILFVVEADRTQRDEIEASLDLIQACPTITMVLNKQQISSRYTFGAYSSYYSS